MKTNINNYTTLFTERQARFLAFADVVTDIYKRIIHNYPSLEERGAISVTLRTVCDNPNYQWLRDEYPSYPRNRSGIWSIIHQKNATQRKLLALRQKNDSRTDNTNTTRQ